MFSNIQVVLVIDTHSYCLWKENSITLEDHLSKLNLASLKLLSELATLSAKGQESIRWGYKYYNSSHFKPDTSRKNFEDFSASTFDIFGKDIHLQHMKHLEIKHEIEKDVKGLALSKTLQETIMDYDWDRPVICSPVKRTRQAGKKQRNFHVDSEINLIVVYTSLHDNGDVNDKHPTHFLQTVIDKTLKQGIAEKNISLHFVNCSDTNVSSNFKTIINKPLGLVKGCIHELDQLVKSSVSFNGTKFTDTVYAYPLISFVRKRWLNFTNEHALKVNQVSESTIIWEDEAGVSHVQIPITVQKFDARNTTDWAPLIVCGTLRAGSSPFLAIANANSDFSLCSSKETNIFNQLLKILKAQDSCLVLYHKFNGIIFFQPLVENLGCLVTFSASGLASAPISESVSESANESLTNFIHSFVKKALMAAPAIQEISCGNGSIFNNQMMKPYYPSSNKLGTSQKKEKPVNTKRAILFNELKKKYRPYVPEMLSSLHDGPLSTEKDPILNGKENIGNSSSEKAVTRGRLLASQSSKYQAELKAKEHQIELHAKHEANKKKIAIEEKRTRKSNLLTAKILNDLNDPTDRKELVQSLIKLRDTLGVCEENSYGSRRVSEEDLLVLSQTIVSTTMSVLRSNCPPFLIGTEIQATLRDGIFMKPNEIFSNFEDLYWFIQMKLQVLLHLELLWHLCSANSVDSNEMLSNEEKDTDEHTEEILKHLRSMSMKINATSMACFLDQTVLPCYEASLGKILCNIYEEMNVSIPDCLLTYLSQEELSPIKTCRIKFLAEIPKLEPKKIEISPTKKTNFRRTSSRIAIKSSLNVRQIKIRKPNNLKRSNSVKAEDDKHEAVKGVRRNLFDFDSEKSNSKLRRCKTISEFPNTIQRTPRKRKADIAFNSDSDGLVLSPSQLEHLSPSSKRRKVYALETPVKCVGKNLFNAQRVLKSSGATVVGESPDSKNIYSPTRRSSLNLARSRSFYSGGTSRNFEKGKKSLMVSYLQSSLTRSNSSVSDDGSCKFLFSNFLK